MLVKAWLLASLPLLATAASTIFEGSLDLSQLQESGEKIDDASGLASQVTHKTQQVRKASTSCQAGDATCAAQDRKVVIIRSSNSATDDVSAEFEQGLRIANHGGVLKLERDKTYVIGKVLDLSWLEDVHVQHEGTIKFTDDLRYWRKNHISHPFQDSISFWKWGGSNVQIYGGGTIDGNGQKWWDAAADDPEDMTTQSIPVLDQGSRKRAFKRAENNRFRRPILFLAQNMTGLSVSNINFRNPPAWNSFFVDSRDISVDRCNLSAKSTSKNVRPKNTDGFDTYNVNGMRITNCRLDVDDDCVSAKPNTTNLLVENLYCKGTHGISMGSIGQYSKSEDYISNVLVSNVTLVDGTNGIRLKTWAGKNTGYGFMKNITYTNIYVQNVDLPIGLDQCYFGVSREDCQRYPSRVNIEDVRFINVSGTSSGKRHGVVGSLKCSVAANCMNFELKDINLRHRAGVADKPIILCNGLKNVTAGSCASTRSRAHARTREGNRTIKSHGKKSSSQSRNFLLNTSPLSITLLALVAAFL